MNISKLMKRTLPFTCALIAVAARLLILALVAFVATGCNSSSPSWYSSPRLTGRVLDAQTQQPIQGVQVQRLTPRDPNVDQVIKGGQSLEKSPAVRTGNDGSFVLVSERNLAQFSRAGWYSVSLAFAHPNYEGLTTGFTLADATNTPSGEPLVKVGDIRLQPKPN